MYAETAGLKRAGTGSKNKNEQQEKKQNLYLASVPRVLMSKKPDMVFVIITVFVMSVLASSVAQSALM